MVEAVTVVDAVMGAGKSSWALQLMNETPQENYLFVTPFLSEVQRVINATDGFVQPKNWSKGKVSSKLESINNLMASQHNIASTHALFKTFNQESFDLIEAGDYILILDETVNMVEPYTGITKTEFDKLRRLSAEGERLIDVDDDGFVVWLKDDCNLDQYADLKALADNHMLMLIRDRFLILQYNPELFRHFKKIYILTYMFSACYLKLFFDVYKIPYQKKTVVYEDGRYELTAYRPADVTKYKDLIHIYEGRYNENFRVKYTMLSVRYFSNGNSDVVKQIQSNTRRYFETVRAKSKDILWSTYKDQRKNLTGRGWSKGYVTWNLRATNDYSHTWAMAYLLNPNMHPGVCHYFENNGITITKEQEDLYSLSELVQWLWRSRIRKGEPVEIYIPCPRMRELLHRWLNGELGN